MVYLSSFKNNISVVCGLGLAPVKGDVDGPAPKHNSDSMDIVDEALYYFRANIFFKNFEIEGPSDITLLYLTFFINHCLQLAAKESRLYKKAKLLQNLAKNYLKQRELVYRSHEVELN